MRQLILMAVLVATVTLIAGQSDGQGNFRVTYKIKGIDATHTELVGNVANEARVDALDVEVTAEAVDGSGRVLARGLAYVAPGILSPRSRPLTSCR